MKAVTLDKDYAGVLFSSLCFLHCVSGPIILALGVTSFGFSFLLDEKIHLALIVPIILFAAWSIPKGYLLHRKLFPVIAAISGMVLLFMGLLIHDLEMPLTLLASSLLIIAHLTNKKVLENEDNNMGSI